MSVTIRVDTTSLTEGMSDLGKRQVPFALSNTLNNVLIDGQKEAVRGIRARFQIRRDSFLQRAVKMQKFANRRDLTAQLAVTGPNADVFTQHEDGGTKTPRLARALAIPREVKRTKSQVIGKAQRPRALELKQVGSSGVSKGKRGTFAIRDAQGVGGIFQRTGKGARSKVRLLYAYRRTAQLRPTLEFVDTVTETIAQRFDRQFEIAFTNAVRTAR
jgi:hypothetical protein